MNSLPADLEIFITADGSPTLALKRADGYIEKMHHSGGALSESLYIYHEALKQSLRIPASPRILSLGLGVAYNELIAIAELGATEDWKIWSFEARLDLREGFAGWAKGETSAFGEVFEEVNKQTAAHFQMEPALLKSKAREALASGRLQLRGPFPQEANEVSGCTCIFYDAFSKKMDPELWDENEIQKALEKAAGPASILATYAATGALNRILKNLNFKASERPGFMGKRESTFAIRGTGL